MTPAVWITVTLFIVMGLLFGAMAYFRFRGRQELQITIRSGIEAGRELTPEVMQNLIESLNPPKAPNADFRRGAISMAFGIAFVVFGFFVNGASEGEALMPMIGISAFPFLIGIAYLIMWQINRKKDNFHYLTISDEALVAQAAAGQASIEHADRGLIRSGQAQPEDEAELRRQARRD